MDRLVREVEDLQRVKALADKWLGYPYDRQTQAEVRKLLSSEEELIDAFYQDLSFGTGGVRARMGVGTNRINRYTLGLITQGIANHLIQHARGSKVRVAVAYDTRNHSQELARSTAEIFSGNGITTFLFREPRPTPQLAFTVRHLKCQLGVVITASHNPKEYNGYKVYSAQGAQITSPLDHELIQEVRQVTDFKSVNSSQENIVLIDAALDQIYFKEIQKRLFYSYSLEGEREPILYSPLHGTGCYTVPACLKAAGLGPVQLVLDQSQPDGNFPTVLSPNPEERNALALGIAKMEQHHLRLFMATDPDSDRLAVVSRERGTTFLLNGNQIGVLLANYLLENLLERGRIRSDAFMVRTIVTSSLIDLIAAKFGVTVHKVLTGFKNVGALIHHNRESQFVFGMEESYGYLIGDYVLDKDAVGACAMVLEMFYWLNQKNLSFMDQLNLLYLEHGYFLDDLVSVVKEGKSGLEEIANLMAEYRSQPPRNIAHHKINIMRDFQCGKEINFEKNLETSIDFPISDVIQFELSDRTVVSIRPSGTEPKLKYYFNLSQEVVDGGLEQSKQLAQTRMDQIKQAWMGVV